MDSPTNVRVELGERSYDIEVGSGNLAHASQFLLGCKTFTHAILVTDENVDQPYADPLGDARVDRFRRDREPIRRGHLRSKVGVLPGAA